MESKDAITVESKELSVNITHNAITQLNEQSRQLQSFVKSQMQPDTDYGVIPGTHKPSLYKPGAEKLRKIFQLGSRIVDKTEVIDWDKNFAMFSYTIEVFHIPSGKAISQCQGSANSHEKKYKEKKKYKNGKPDGTEPVPIAEILNTLQKMAQKRADVGATISATNASALFTQDIEDLKDSGLLNTQKSFNQTKENKQRPETPERNVSKTDIPRETTDPESYTIKYGKQKGMQLNETDPLDLQSYIGWIKSLPDAKQFLLDEKNTIEEYLRYKKIEKEVEPPPFPNDEDQIPF